MKRIYLLLLAMLSVVTVDASCREDNRFFIADRGFGDIVMEPRSSRMVFDEIEVSGAIRLIVEERTSGNIIIRAPRQLLEYVTLFVSDHTLHASFRFPNSFGRRNIPGCVVEIYVPNNGRISEITARGASTVNVKPTLAGAELDVEASGASRVSLSTIADKVSAELSGASTLRLEAQSRELDAEVSGASTLKCEGVIAARAEIEVSGASTIRIEEMSVAMLDLEVTSASSATARCDAGLLDVSGASSVTVECAHTLAVSASSASTIRYKGDCAVDVKSMTGASSIKKM